MSIKFQGVAPHVRRALASPQFAGLDGADGNRAVRLEPVARVQSALGQAADAPPGRRGEIAANALRWRGVLALALAGVDAAIAEFAALADAGGTGDADGE